MKRAPVIPVMILLLLAGCEKTPDTFPPEPQIYYQTTTPRTVDLQQAESNVRISLKFTDGDGDLGRDPGEMERNIFLKDSRDTTASPFTIDYPFPYIPDNIRHKDGGLQGNIDLILNKGYFSPNPLDSARMDLGGDTLQYAIYIIDRAGNKSNVITTDSIYIKF